VTVQLVGDNLEIDPAGECWSATFGDGNTIHANLAAKFKSKRRIESP
jgi:hypothetical protein